MSAPVAPAPTSTNAPASGVSGFFGSLFGAKKPANSSSPVAVGGRRRKHSMKRSKRHTRRHRSKKSKSRRNRN